MYLCNHRDQRVRTGVLESLQPSNFGNFPVKAVATKLPVSLFRRAVVDDVVAWRDLATTVATDFLFPTELDWIHFQGVQPECDGRTGSSRPWSFLLFSSCEFHSSPRPVARESASKTQAYAEVHAPGTT